MLGERAERLFSSTVRFERGTPDFERGTPDKGSPNSESRRVGARSQSTTRNHAKMALASIRSVRDTADCGGAARDKRELSDGSSDPLIVLVCDHVESNLSKGAALNERGVGTARDAPLFSTHAGATRRHGART
jgi:hypothetical protein